MDLPFEDRTLLSHVTPKRVGILSLLAFVGHGLWVVATTPDNTPVQKKHMVCIAHAGAKGDIPSLKMVRYASKTGQELQTYRPGELGRYWKEVGENIRSGSYYAAEYIDYAGKPFRPQTSNCALQDHAARTDFGPAGTR